ncbi:MAG TPA: (2Fe-2S)-binding protein [Burkholderiaceae bacterium]|nr:(2Fe-2S)-binding protein [Burkholderiaceae bacterium]
MFICICNAITDRHIIDMVKAGTCSAADVADALGVGSRCGCCREAAQSVIAAAAGPSSGDGCAAAVAQAT